MTDNNLNQGLVGFVPLNNDGTVVAGLPNPTQDPLYSGPGVNPDATVRKPGVPYILCQYSVFLTETGFPTGVCHVSSPDKNFFGWIQPNGAEFGSILYITIGGSTNAYQADADSPYWEYPKSTPELPNPQALHVMFEIAGPAQVIYPLLQYIFNEVYFAAWVQTPPGDSTIIPITLHNSGFNTGMDGSIFDSVWVTVWAVDLGPGVSQYKPDARTIDGGKQLTGGLDANMNVTSTVTGQIEHSVQIVGPQPVFGPWTWFNGALGTFWVPFAFPPGGDCVMGPYSTGGGVWVWNGMQWVCEPTMVYGPDGWVSPSGVKIWSGSSWEDGICSPGDVR